MIQIAELLKKYNLPANSLETTNLRAEDLVDIHKDQVSRTPDLERVGDFVTGQLRRVSQVHSLRYRVKDPEHLVAKIIRKRIEQSDRNINIGNYTDEITDLIGVRVLHLFKEDWESIHDYISSTWGFKEPPTANVRAGDSEKWDRAFKAKGCTIKVHKSGYRSVHYLITSQPTKLIYTTEVQVRTIFEEGWSEVDHDIRYPNDQDNPILAPLLFILNRLAGSADEIASYIQELKTLTDTRENTHQQVLSERDQKVADLQAKIERLEIDADAKRELKEGLDTINTYEIVPAAQPASSEVRRYLSPTPSYLSYFEPLPKCLRRDPLTEMVAKFGSASVSADLVAKLGHTDLLTDSLAKHGNLFGDPLGKYRSLFADPLIRNSALYSDPRITGHTSRGVVAGPEAKTQVSSSGVQSGITQSPKINTDETEVGAPPSAEIGERLLSVVDVSGDSHSEPTRTTKTTQTISHIAESLDNAGTTVVPAAEDNENE